MTEGWDSDAAAIGLSRDGATLVTAPGGLSRNKRIGVWDTKSGKPVRWIDHRDPARWFVMTVTLGPDARTVAIGTQSAGVQLFDVGSGKWLRALGREAASPDAVAWSRDGGKLACASQDGVRSWDIAAATLVGPLGTAEAGLVDALAFDPEARTLAEASEKIRLWELASGKELFAVDRAKPAANLIFGRDGATVASGDAVWLVPRGDVGARPTAYAGPIAHSPDGKAVAKNEGTDVILRDPEGNVRRRLPHPQAASWLAFSADGGLLVSVAEAIRVWNAQTGTIDRALPTPAPMKLGPRVAARASFSDDGKRLFVSAEGVGAVWDTRPRGTRAVFAAGHPRQPRRLRHHAGSGAEDRAPRGRGPRLRAMPPRSDDVSVRSLHRALRDAGTRREAPCRRREPAGALTAEAHARVQGRDRRLGRPGVGHRVVGAARAKLVT